MSAIPVTQDLVDQETLQSIVKVCVRQPPPAVPMAPPLQEILANAATRTSTSTVTARGPESSDLVAVLQEVSSQTPLQLMAAGYLTDVQREYGAFKMAPDGLAAMALLHLFHDRGELSMPRSAAQQATSLLLDQLATNVSRSTSDVADLAVAIRGLVPDCYDTWVDQQLQHGMVLAVMARSRKPGAAEELLTRQVKAGSMVAQTALGQPDGVLLNFSMIFRHRLIADLKLKTADDLLLLDSALNSFIMARRLAAYASNYLSPSPSEKAFFTGLKLLKEAEKYDKAFQRIIGRLRTQTMTASRGVQILAGSGSAVQILNGPSKAA